ncbi:MAG: DUF2796 domain-containing protein [Pseudomonadales bacterium]|nr:DUF2796 domain-containing protein [Pseudomonadales bacterium]
MSRFKSVPAGLLAGSLCLFSSTNSLGNEATHRQHGAHVHGTATLNIAQEGQRLDIIFESPAANLVGFEHAPENKQQKQALAEAVTQLKQGATLFTPNPEAECTLKSADLDSSLIHHNEHAEEHDDHDEEHDEHEADGHYEEHEHNEEHAHDKEHGHDEAHESHSEMLATYQFHCASPEKLKTISVNLFKSFSGTEKITGQLITAQQQRALELDAHGPIITFK